MKTDLELRSFEKYIGSTEDFINDYLYISEPNSKIVGMGISCYVGHHMVRKYAFHVILDSLSAKHWKGRPVLRDDVTGFALRKGMMRVITMGIKV